MLVPFLVRRKGFSEPTSFRPLRAVPERLCGARDFTIRKCFRAFAVASTYTPFGGSHPFTLIFLNKKTAQANACTVLVRRKGFEPPTFWFVAKHSIQLSYRRLFGDPDGNRTRVTAVKGRCLNRLTTGPYEKAPIFQYPF